MNANALAQLATKKTLIIGSALLCATILGFALGKATHAANEQPPPAYMIVSSKLIEHGDIQPYRDAAGPLARAAGLELLAGRPDPTVTVLEGEWPYEEGIIIERFTSMKALKDFWFSKGYQEAKKLREGVVKINFIVAIEGIAEE